MSAIATPAGSSTRDPRDALFGQPKGVYVCFFTEMWERFSFYGMKALLLLYLIQHHRFLESSGYDVLGAYGGLVYCLPVFGGMLADRWLGKRKAVVFGGILLCLGHFGMAFEGAQATEVHGLVVRDDAALRVFYLSLSLIIMGVGFLKPNISTIVGNLYAQDDPRRDSGFSLFYAGINLGALFGSIVCGYLGLQIAWSWGFGAAGIGMLLGLGQFIWGQRYLHGHAEPPDPRLLRERVLGVPREWMIYAAAVAALVPVAGLMWAVANHAFALGGEVSLAMLLMIVVMMGVLAWFTWFIVARCTPVQRHQMLALMAMITMCLVFFILYEQTYGSWVTFTDRLLTKDIVPSLVQVQPQRIVFNGDFKANILLFARYAPWSTVSLVLAPLSFMVAARLSDRNPLSTLPQLLFIGAFVLVVVFVVRDSLVLPQTASSLTYLSGPFILLLAPLFGWLWAFLGRRGADPSKPTKSALGLMFAGLSFVPMALAAQRAGAAGGMVSVWWLVLAYGVLEIGEMCLSPVGLSAVTQLSVPSVASLMMGTWFLATAFSETLAAQFGKLTALDIPEGATLDVAEASAKYAHLFWMLTGVGLVCALAAFLLAPMLRRMMHGAR